MRRTTPPRQEWPSDFEERYLAAGYWTDETLPGYFRARAEAHPERVAVATADGRHSYGEIDRRSDAVAAGLRAAGLGPGDRVVLQLPNVVEFFTALFGTMRAGLIPVYALPAHRRSEIVHFVQGADARAFITCDRFAGYDHRVLAREVQAEVGPLDTFIVGEAEEFHSFAALEATPPRRFDDPDPAAVAFLQLSGGSTGLSKLIPRTHRDYVYTLRESARICELSESTVYLGTLPIAHNFPMSSPGTLGTFYAGGTVSLTLSPSPEAAFAAIERDRVTITGVVPPLAILWTRAAATTAFDLSSLEVLQVGGARFAPEAARLVEPALGVTLQQVYGMAEGLVNYTRLDDPEEVRILTQGRPISPDDEIRIVDAAGRPVAEGEAGELQTRGPYTIRRYHADAETQRRAFTADGFYRTGDLVSQTPEGNLVVRGRVSDVINRGGEKIPVEEVENHLIGHERILDAVVVGIPDPLFGERSCAVVIADSPAPSARELRAWVRARGVAGFKVPDEFVFTNRFPATGVGKVSRGELRAALRESLRERQPESADA